MLVNRRRRAVSAALILVTAGITSLSGTGAQAAVDPEMSKQWGLKAPTATTYGIGAETAWARSKGQGVIIGIVDTGIDLNHPDLQGKVIATADCIGAGKRADKSCTAGGADDNGHGTHVAGIAAAATGNGVGIAGVAPDAKLVVAKALTASSGGSVDDIKAAIAWTVSKGAKVVNLSIASSLLGSLLGGGNTLAQAVNDAYAAGAVVVIAAGNTNLLGLGGQNYGDMKGIVVGATGPDGKAASYSSPLGDAKWAILAPGGADNANRPQDDIYSTYWKKSGSPASTYEYLRGTSMAAPHVAGVAALLWAGHPNITKDHVINYILTSADPLAGGASCGQFCVGRLNAAKAVAKLPPLPQSTTTTTTKPVTPPTTAPDQSAASTPAPLQPAGYVIVDETGRAAAFGGVPFQGEIPVPPKLPVVGVAEVPRLRDGYWMVTADGEVYNYGQARNYGSAGSLKLNLPIVGMAPTHLGAGYWLVATDGGIFSYGDAKFYGSTGNVKLNKPIVGMTSTPTGKGYWLVASDGGIFSFGDARFFGSTGNVKLNKPIVGMAVTPTGKGYWLVASDGGVFSFGDAKFFGSTGDVKLNKPIVGMAASPTGKGYWMVASDGGIFSFGASPFLGSAANTGMGRVVGMASN
jgi:hypothetical protein